MQGGDICCTCIINTTVDSNYQQLLRVIQHNSPLITESLVIQTINKALPLV